MRDRRRGAPAPAPPLIVDGYIRVSRANRRRAPRFISPAVQREQIAFWARAMGATVAEVFEDIDRSGTRADRLGLEAAIRRVEAQLTQGLVVWKLDRFFRSSLEGQMALRRVMAAGGTLFSVLDGIDSRTDAGRHMLRITLSNAELESDRIRIHWNHAVARAIRRGAYPISSTPVGYRRTRDGRLRPDPLSGPVITEFFRRRANGASTLQLSAWLTEQGVRTTRGHPVWSYPSTLELIRKRVYLGELHWGPYHHEGAHPALTDPATWELAQRPRQETYHWARLPSLLGGLVRCASCSMACSPVRNTRRRYDYRLYKCHGHSASGPCRWRASIDSTRLEAYVTDAIFELLRKRRRPAIARLREAAEAVADAQDALVSYRDNMRLLSVLGEEAFAAGLGVRMEAVRDTRLALAHERARRAQHELPALPEIQRDWPGMSLEEQRQVIRQLIDCVFVAPGRSKSIDERVTICPTGTAPARLPRAGDKGNNARPFRGPLKRPRPPSRRPDTPIR
jgi:DNA invertase Pin-like site-specific DNA recombinase